MKIFGFLRMMVLMYQTFFLLRDDKETFPIIELGPFLGSKETLSLVYLYKGFHPQHVHDKSDAKFYFHSGAGVIIVGEEQKEVPFDSGTTYYVRKGVPHGFLVKKAGIFVAWQEQAITDHLTGERDVRYPS